MYARASQQLLLQSKLTVQQQQQYMSCILLRLLPHALTVMQLLQLQHESYSVQACILLYTVK